MRWIPARLGWYSGLLALDSVTEARKRARRWLQGKPKPIQLPSRISCLGHLAWWVVIVAMGQVVKSLPHHTALLVEYGLLAVGALSVAYIVMRIVVTALDSAVRRRSGSGRA